MASFGIVKAFRAISPIICVRKAEPRRSRCSLYSDFGIFALSCNHRRILRLLMLIKTSSFGKVTKMGCGSCFGFEFAFGRKSKMSGRPYVQTRNNTSKELLTDDDLGNEDDYSNNGDVTNTGNQYNDSEMQTPTKRSEEIITYKIQHGLICRELRVKETHRLVRSEDDDGNKMVNEYVRKCKIGSGSYGKVVLYRSSTNGKHYAIKVFHKSHLLKLRVALSETAMTDVLREVLIMKMVDHPNIVNLVEVIDDPTANHFYMVLEYLEGKLICEGPGLPNGLSENKIRNYFRDVVCGLMYLHAHNIIHGDIKPDNLLVTATGTVKIGDFSVSQVIEDDHDKLRRSPGTPVFTAPECCLGFAYRGKPADTWAVGVTLYFMALGSYPFLGETLQDTYDKIMNNHLSIPDHINPLLRNLLEGLLCKDPVKRLTLGEVAKHEWVVGEEGLIPQYLCWCKRKIGSNT